MTYSTPALAQFEAELPAILRDHERDMLRHRAAEYERDTNALYRWTFPPSRDAVFRAVHRPDDPRVTKALCHAIYADLQSARRLPRYIQSKAMRISVLRELFACECWRYLNQRRAAMMQAAE